MANIQISFDKKFPKVLSEKKSTDLLFLPNDSGFKYCLTVIDCASRYKWAAPVRSKTASAITNAFQKIMKEENYKNP
jgi:hypothetical protein